MTARRFFAVLIVVAWAGISPVRAQPAAVDLLLHGGNVLDGAGNPWDRWDVGIAGERIVFVGNGALKGIQAKETLDVSGLLVTPGFWDVHSHARLDLPEGKRALPPLHQGVTTVVLGVDGGGEASVADIFRGYRDKGIAVNAIHYVGHNAARRAVMGMADRAPTEREMEAMKAYVERGMREGAVGLSTGLFYTPGYYARTDEVVELARVAARYGGILLLGVRSLIFVPGYAMWLPPAHLWRLKTVASGESLLIFPASSIAGCQPRLALRRARSTLSPRRPRADFLLAVIGSPDWCQIDGLGRATSLTSKAMLIGRPFTM